MLLWNTNTQAISTLVKFCYMSHIKIPRKIEHPWKLSSLFKPGLLQ